MLFVPAVNHQQRTANTVNRRSDVLSAALQKNLSRTGLSGQIHPFRRRVWLLPDAHPAIDEEHLTVDMFGGIA